MSDRKARMKKARYQKRDRLGKFKGKKGTASKAYKKDVRKLFRNKRRKIKGR